MGLIERAESIFANRLFPKGENFGPLQTLMIDISFEKDRRELMSQLQITLDIKLSEIYETTNFDDLIASDKFEVVKNALFKELSLDRKDPRELNQELILAQMFFGNSQIVDNFNSFPDDYDDDNAIDDMSNQMALFCNNNQIDFSWGDKIIERIATLYGVSDYSILVLDEIANLMSKDPDKFEVAYHYIKAVNEYKKGLKYLKKVAMSKQSFE